jgi:hypothetical protein
LLGAASSEKALDVSDDRTVVVVEPFAQEQIERVLVLVEPAVQGQACGIQAPTIAAQGRQRDHIEMALLDGGIDDSFRCGDRRRSPLGGASTLRNRVVAEEDGQAKKHGPHCTKDRRHSGMILPLTMDVIFAGS